MTTASHVEAAHVTVVGAGPAGTAAAITLARLGRSALLIDKATFPRDKCCGDGLTTAALRRLEGLGLNPSDVPSWQPSRDVCVVTAGGARVELRLPAEGTFAATATRRDLDWALLRLAERAGVRVLQGTSLRSIARDGDEGVVIRTDEGSTLRSDYVIAADGMWSSSRKALGTSAPAYLGDWQAGRQYFESVGPQARKLWIWFEPDMVPGYAWSFPLADGRVNVGYGVLRDREGDGGQRGLKGRQVGFLERARIAEVLGPAARPCSPWRSWPIPAGISGAASSALGGRVLFVGDAARAADPMTGEGIAQALETAEIAARSIVSAGRGDPAAAARAGTAAGSASASRWTTVFPSCFRGCWRGRTVRIAPFASSSSTTD